MQVALVTGGTKGIGLEAVRRFHGAGYQVVTCSRNNASWLQAVKDSPELAPVDYVQCDLSSPDNIDALFAHIKQAHGRLDVAVNNASPKLESTGAFSAVDTDKLYHTLMTDFWSHALCLRQELRLMQTGAAVVNVSSVNGLRPTPNAAMYSAAKHALESLTRSVALEAIEQGIRVNAVAPGVTWTPRWAQRVAEAGGDLRSDVESIVPIKRFATAGEVADAIEWLASDKASYIIGHTLVIDGGLSLK